MDDKNVLTDEQVDEINEVIESADSPSRDAIEQSKEEAANEEVINHEEVVDVITDPNTGNPLPVNVDEEGDSKFNLFDKSFEELLADDSIQAQDINIDTVNITEENVKNVLEPLFEDFKGFSLADMTELINLSKRVMKDEKFAYYNSLPLSCKTVIDSMIGVKASEMGSMYKEGRNYVAHSLLKEIANNAIIDTTIYDFQKIMKETTAQFSDKIQQDEYWYSVRKYFTKTTLEKAEEYEANGKPEIAQRFRDVRESFVQSYTYEDMKGLYNAGKLRIKKIEVEKFKRTANEFNFMYKNSQNTIQNVEQLLPVLDKNTDDDITLDTIKKFIIAFIKFVQYKKLDPNSFKDHTFMYYFIYNILTIANYDHNNEEDIKFHFQLINNINSFMRLIQNKK